MSLVVDIEKKLGSFQLKTAFETDHNNSSVLGLLGASGCGKSMTLRCIAGIERPDKGHIELDGVTLFDSEKHIDLKPQQRHVGYLFQSYALFPNMTARENVLCGACRLKDRREKEKAADEMLQRLQLAELADHKPSQLSGGQQQRVALARILVNQPKLLMLDEPFSALDSHLRMKLQMELKTLLSSFERDVLLVTHSRDEAYHLCDSIAVMDAGRVMTCRETKALFADPGSIRAAVLTGCKNITPAHKTGEYEIEAPEWGIRLATAQPVRKDLKAVGIRAHYFHPDEPRNRFEVTWDSEMEEPFEWVIQFRYAGQNPASEPVWRRVAKEGKPDRIPRALGVAPENVLLLYE